MRSFVRSRRFRFLDIDIPAIESLAIELNDCVFQLIISLQYHESDPSRPTRFSIGHNLDRLYRKPVRFKPVLKIGIRNLKRQVSDKELGHGFLPEHSFLVRLIKNDTSCLESAMPATHSRALYRNRIALNVCQYRHS
jgi:hypothetical protein